MRFSPARRDTPARMGLIEPSPFRDLGPGGAGYPLVGEQESVRAGAVFEPNIVVRGIPQRLAQERHPARVRGRKRLFRLVLRRPARDVTGFTDRPARGTGQQPLARFVRGWAGLGFAEVPPNAAVELPCATTVTPGRPTRDIAKTGPSSLSSCGPPRRPALVIELKGASCGGCCWCSAAAPGRNLCRRPSSSLPRWE
jgi:hypothetical protein